MHPIYLLVSLAASLCFKIKLEGRTAVSYFFRFIVPFILFAALFNMLFTHYGVTVLFTAFGTRFTLEGFFYGLCRGTMFSAVIMWFSCYSGVVTSERFLAVFGRLAPNCALVFSMVLSFIPRLKKNAAEINDAAMLLYSGESKLKRSVKSFSSLLTMTLEESIEVSDSMRARGFGKGRSVYSKYGFSVKDGVCAGFILLLFIILCVLKSLGNTEFVFDPAIEMESFSPSAFVLYLLISFLPVTVDLTEDIRWFYLKRKI